MILHRIVKQRMAELGVLPSDLIETSLPLGKTQRWLNNPKHARLTDEETWALLFALRLTIVPDELRDNNEPEPVPEGLGMRPV